MKTFAAAAAARFIRIHEIKTRIAQFIRDVIHRRPEQHPRMHFWNPDCRAALLEFFIIRQIIRRLDVFHFITVAGASCRLDRQAHTLRAFRRFGHQRFDLRGGFFGNLDRRCHHFYSNSLFVIPAQAGIHFSFSGSPFSRG